MTDKEYYHRRTYRFCTHVLNSRVVDSHALCIEARWELVPEDPDVSRVGIKEIWKVTEMRYTLDGMEFQREELEKILQRYVEILSLDMPGRRRVRLAHLVQKWGFDTLLCAAQNNLHPN